MIFCCTKRLVLGLAALSIAGCGLKGPLSLPDQARQETVAPESESETKAPRKRPTAPNPAPQSQKDDDAERQSAPPVALPDPARPADAAPVPPPDH